jgi:hypothetical protein
VRPKDLQQAWSKFEWRELYDFLYRKLGWKDRVKDEVLESTVGERQTGPSQPHDKD